MALKKKRKEIERLISAFEREANKFHDIEFNLMYLYADKEPKPLKINPERYAVVLSILT